MVSDESRPVDPITEIDRLIHEPSRYTIAALLYVVQNADFLFVQHQTGLTPGNLSAHLGKLESAGYIKIKKSFAGKYPRTVLSLTRSGRQSFENYRKKMKQVLDDLPKGDGSRRKS